MKAISIHLTDRCNNSCKFCVVDSHKEKKEGVDKKIIWNFLDENKDKGYECVNIHGGEPTLEEDLFEILEYIQKSGYPRISLQTNARLLSDMKYAKQLVNLGIDLFTVSVHSIDEEVKAWITGDEHCLEETIKGIRNIKKLGAKVKTNTVVCKQNKEELINIFQYLIDELEIDHINISAIHPTGKAYENFNLVVPRLTEVIPFVKESVDLIESKDTIVTLEGFPPCLLADYSHKLIDWEENDYKLLYKKFILENYDKFMRKKTRHLSSECKKCNHQEICGGLYKEYIEFYGTQELG